MFCVVVPHLVLAFSQLLCSELFSTSIMPGQHGVKCAGDGRHVKEGAGSSCLFTGTQEFSAPSLTVLGISGRSCMISPFFTCTVGTPRSCSIHHDEDIKQIIEVKCGMC